MSVAIFQILTVVAAVFGIMRGFRKGIGRQVGSIAGMLSAIVADHAFHAPLSSAFGFIGGDGSSLIDEFYRSVLISTLIFIIFYFAISFVTGLLGKLFSLMPSGILGSIAGSVWSLFKYMFMLSLCFNLYMGSTGNEALLKCGKDSDGNLAGGVLELAPALLECEDISSLCHRLQLRDAAKISINFNNSGGVMIPEGVITTPHNISRNA